MYINILAGQCTFESATIIYSSKLGIGIIYIYVCIRMYIRRIIRQSGAIKARSNHINHGSFRSPCDTLRLEIELVFGIVNGIGIPSALAICIGNKLLLLSIWICVLCVVCTVATQLDTASLILMIRKLRLINLFDN